ncbi:MAG TPA: cyclic-di-AMP receptor [Candidatus Limiplasma sp.]|nr:cyclic-di-AMP receptor [Candidatus Limiplasma sp.]
MKLIIAIVQDEDSQRLINEMMTEGFRVTKLATTGGFLRSGNTTLLVGVEDEQTESAISLIENICKSRKQVTSAPSPMVNTSGTYTPFPFEVLVGGATVFVLTVDQFFKY